LQDLFKQSFSIFCRLHFKISIKSVSLLHRDDNFVGIGLCRDNYALNSPLMRAIKRDCNPKKTSENLDSSLILGPEAGEFRMLWLRCALAVVARDLGDQFDLVISETRKSI
jgi:hypothetical protein